jgi:hypothetical protein
MRALNKDEIDFLLDRGDAYPEPEWVPVYDLPPPVEQRRRARFFRTRDCLVRMGCVQITAKGHSWHGSYKPAQWKLTPLGKQIFTLLQVRQRYGDHLIQSRMALKNELNFLQPITKD